MRGSVIGEESNVTVVTEKKPNLRKIVDFEMRGFDKPSFFFLPWERRKL